MSSNIREIVTLQIGHYSNFIGSHWLNLQEASFIYNEGVSTDINHDFLFREGKLPNNQECYVPRSLIIDAKGSLGSLPKLGTLYDPSHGNISSSHALWSGKVELFTHTPEEKNDFLKALEAEDAKYHENLDEDKDVCLEDSEMEEGEKMEQKIFDLSGKVNVWSDFLRPHLHPKSIFLLEDVVHLPMDEESGCGWGFIQGMEVFRKESNEEEIMDRVRLLAESCNSLQGFHFLCDIHNGMGGVGAGLLQCLADDYGSKDVFTFASVPPHHKAINGTELACFLTNLVQAYTEFTTFSSLLLPLTLKMDISRPASDVVRWPHIVYKDDCAYENSSILASFLETISVPWRAKSNPMPMNCLVDMLTPLQTKVVGGGFAFPMGLGENTSLHDWFGERGSRSTSFKGSQIPIEFKSVVGDCASQKLAEVSVIRGISNNKLESTPKRIKFDNAWQLYEHYLKKEDLLERQALARLVFGAKDPLKTTSPFPQFFSSHVSEEGFLKSPKTGHCLVSNVPAAANIYQGKGVLQQMKNMAQAASKIQVSKLPNFTADSSENWKHSLETLLSLSENKQGANYNCDQESDSD